MYNEYDSIKREVKLPISFEVQPLSSNSKSLYPLSITILRNLRNINMSVLPEDLFVLNRMIFKLQDNIVQLISSFQGNYFYAEVKEKPSDKYWSACLIYRIYGAFYGLSRFSRDIKVNSIEFHDFCQIPDMSGVDEFIDKATLSQIINSKSNSERNESIINNFSMKVPHNLKDIKVETKPILSSPQAHDDPLKFLHSRYYNLLYSLNTPLTYFPKTGLSRFKILCGNSQEEIKNVLMKACLSIDALDDRYKSRLGVLRLSFESRDVNITNSIVNESEITSQDDFLKKNPELQIKLTSYYTSDNFDDSKFIEKLNTIILELKIREAQIQMIIILELFCSWDINESEFFDIIQKKEKHVLKKKIKLNRSSLIRKKSSKIPRKIMPTFLGMGMHVMNSNNESVTHNIEMDLYDLFNNLNTYIDRIRLWDTLLGRNLENKDDNLFGFLAYVLLPYYNKRIPKILKHIVSKVKNMSIKSISKMKIKETTASLVDEKLILNADEVAKKDKDATNNNVTKSRPTLKRKTVSMPNSKDLLPAFSLKRSKSNLSSKNLQKRQVDMSLNLKSFNESQFQIEKSFSKRTNDTSDKKIKQINSGSKKTKREDFELSISQVEATPFKRKMDINGGSAVHDESGNFSPVSTTRTTISGGRNNYESIGNKSYNSVRKGDLPLSEKLLIASNESLQNEIILSPVKGTNNNFSPAKNLRNFQSPLIIHETPREVINSSPISIKSLVPRNRKKPGMPALIQDSPFYSSTLSGSPPPMKSNQPQKIRKRIIVEGDQMKLFKPTSNFTISDVEEDSDNTIYSPTKGKHNMKTYSRK